jgi:CRP/FNR family transcriptional regulator, cyclic AMP receptor protein
MTTIGYVCGFIGAGLTLASYSMKSMLPLRLVALASNVFFVVYGIYEAAIPSLVLYATLIPINAKKAWDIRRLVRDIERAKADSPVAEWLLPHMKLRLAKAGELLWRQGDRATEMIYVEAGQLRLVEYDELLGPGSLVGEIGLFAPDSKRTRTIVCETDCELYSLSAEGMAQLYYLNPKLGFHVMRLVVARLMRDASQGRAAVPATAASPATEAPGSS